MSGIKKFNGRFFIVEQKILILRNIYRKKKITKTKTYIHFKYIVDSREIY